MKRYVVVVVVLVTVVLAVAGCSKKAPRAQQIVETKPDVQSEAPKSAAAPPPPAVGVAVSKNAFIVPYEPANVKASVAPYTVKADLSNVVNLKRFGKFDALQRATLAQNAFVAVPTDEKQLFFIYEQNDYKNLPSFITTDSVLQVYHVFYDFTLRSVEKHKLYDVLASLAVSMSDESSKVAKQMTDPEWKKAASANEVFFAVPYCLLGKKMTLRSDEQKILNREVALVNKAEGRVMSALFPWKPDYSQFTPRGHYTRSDLFKRYFKAMMWCGYMGLPVDAPTVNTPKGPVGGGPAWPQIRQAVLSTWMLFHSEVGGKPAIESWQRIYEPTTFYVGSSDDLTPFQYKAVMDKVYGPKATLAQLQDEGKLKQVYTELKKLPEPRIDVKLDEAPSGRMLKLMGQRYIPDSEMMQRLVVPIQRVFPKGLDVMAVLGSKRAADILDNIYKEPERWDQYLPNRNKLTEEFSAVPVKTWQSNLYWGWLWSLDSLLDAFGAGYPSFMQNQAWDDKGLNTALGSWAELRHDTILYAKQSAVECGGGGDEPPPPKGYVEPNVEFYNRLLWLTRASKTGLTKRGLISEDLGQKFSDFEDLLTFLKRVSIKELRNERLTAEENDQIKVFGANLEGLTLSVMEGQPNNWYEITSETDKDMAVVADVHTGGVKCLEEGVGHANALYVIVPIGGKLYLTRGAVFSYYEFYEPLSNRLTDEKWQRMLKQRTAPVPPEWTKSFLPSKAHESSAPKEVYSSGC